VAARAKIDFTNPDEPSYALSGNDGAASCFQTEIHSYVNHTKKESGW